MRIATRNTIPHTETASTETGKIPQGIVGQSRSKTLRNPLLVEHLSATSLSLTPICHIITISLYRNLLEFDGSLAVRSRARPS